MEIPKIILYMLDSDSCRWCARWNSCCCTWFIVHKGFDHQYYQWCDLSTHDDMMLYNEFNCCNYMFTFCFLRAHRQLHPTWTLSHMNMFSTRFALISVTGTRLEVSVNRATKRLYVQLRLHNKPIVGCEMGLKCFSFCCRGDLWHFYQHVLLFNFGHEPFTLHKQHGNRSESLVSDEGSVGSKPRPFITSHSCWRWWIWI